MVVVVNQVSELEKLMFNLKNVSKMKNLKVMMVTLMMCLMTMVSFGQEIKYDDVQSGTVTKGKFDSYVSKDGSTYKIGDKIQIGTPSGINGKFVTIQKVDVIGTVYVVGAEAINTSAEIKRIRVRGNKRTGYKVSFQTKGMTGLDNYFVYIEDAIQVGEIKSFGMTSDEALNELKKAKDKLELGLITQDEFDKLKQELSKYIK